MANTLQKSLGATGVLYDERRDFYISPNVTKELWTDVAPFTTTLANIETRSDLKDPIFKMFEHRNPWQKQEFTLTAAVTVPDNDTGIAHGAAIAAYSGLGAPDDAWLGLAVEVWDSTKTTRRGVAIITAMVNGDEPTLKLLSGAAFTTVIGDIAVVIGNAQGEGMESPEPWADELSIVWNSTQIFKTPLQITGTLEAAVLRGESSELSRLRSQKSQEHKIQKERSFLLGQRIGGTGLADARDGASNESFDDSGRTSHTINGTSGKVRSTYGALSAVLDYGSSNTADDHQNIFPVTEASFSYSDFVDVTEKVFQYVPTSGFKRAFCGAGMLSYWNKMSQSGFSGNSDWHINLGDMDRDRLGFNYRMLETPHGVIQLIPTPVLTRSPYNKYMLIIDDSNVFHAQYRPSKYQTNIKTDNAYDGTKDQYFCDEGIGLQMIESHSVFYLQ
jgi:hypothetical protein